MAALSLSTCRCVGLVEIWKNFLIFISLNSLSVAMPLALYASLSLESSPELRMNRMIKVRCGKRWRMGDEKGAVKVW